MRASRFARAYEQMVARYAPPGDELTDAQILIHNAARSWVRGEACVVGKVTPPTVYNAALALAGLRAFAERNGIYTRLYAPDRSVRQEVPTWRLFDRKADDVLTRFVLLRETCSVLNWADDQIVRVETLMENGLVTLGALATMPEGSGLVALDVTTVLTDLKPTFTIAGADPYPPTVAPAT